MLEEELADMPPSEMLPEDFPQQIRFVFVMPPTQTEHLSEIDRIKIRPEAPTKDSPPSEDLPKVELPSPLKKPVAKGKSTTSPQCSPRRLFTDNWNSFWHIAFGVLAVKFKMLVPLFIFYQFLDMGEVNVFVDIIEFLCGYILGVVFSLI